MPRPVDNPPNPWASTHVEYLEEPPSAALVVYEEEARSVLSENQSPDIGFRFSVNPYRGCMHACAYCYARPSHQYWGFGAGTDFDRRIVVKVNAPEVLRSEMMRRSWEGDTIVFSGNTDCYQPLEASYALTQRCLEVCLEMRNPVGLITKSALITRDAKLLGRLAREARCSVTLSVAFADTEMARKIEPWAAKPERRFEAMRALADEGVPVGVLVAPVIPGLNETAIPEVLERSKEAGAGWAGMVLLRLPAEVKPVFLERLDEAFPERAAKVKNGLLELRGGKMHNAAFGERFVGKGPRWEAIRTLFDVHAKRLGLANRGEDEAPMATDNRKTTFRRPSKQGTLFDL